jgi:predicted Zn finger-like uncharacterized protein
MIRFACPNCRSAYRVNDEFAGRTTRCRACSETFLVPLASATTEVERNKPTAQAAALPAQAVPADAGDNQDFDLLITDSSLVPQPPPPPRPPQARPVQPPPVQPPPGPAKTASVPPPKMQPPLAQPPLAQPPRVQPAQPSITPVAQAPPQAEPAPPAQPAMTAQPAAAPRFCTQCGTGLTAGIRFCGQCGAPVTPSAAPAAAEVPVAVKVEVVCLVCGKENPEGTQKCGRCQLPMNDLDLLRRRRQKLIAEQRRLRTELSRNAAREFYPEEYIAFLTPGEREARTYVVTERRLLVFSVEEGRYEERDLLDYSIPFRDIISYSALETESDIWSLRSRFVVEARRGSARFWFDSSFEMENNQYLDFYRAFQRMYAAHENGTTPSDVLLFRAKL